MRVTLILFLILMRTSYASDDCFSLMKAFLTPSKSSTAPIQATVTSELLQKTLKQAKELELRDEIISELRKTLSQMDPLPPKRLLESYIIFLESVANKHQLDALAELPQILKESPEGKFAKKFLKLQKNIDKKEASKLKKTLAEFKEKYPEKNDREIRFSAIRETRKFRNEYERLTYGCRSTKWTPERKAAATSFKKFTIGIGMASGIGGYYWNNRDKPIDGVWIGRLGYETVWGIVTGWLGAKIVSNPETGMVAMGIQKYLFARANGLVDMGIYGFLFSASQDDAEKKLHELINDPEREKTILELKKVLEEKGRFQQLKDAIARNVAKVGLPMKATPELEIEGVDWENLSDEDLEREDVKDVLMAMVAASLYQEQKGKYISTGDVGADRYTFHAAYGLVMLPKDMFVSLYIYNILCMGQMNQKASLLKAVGLFTLNRLVFDQLYYFTRREAINQ